MSNKKLKFKYIHSHRKGNYSTKNCMLAHPHLPELSCTVRSLNLKDRSYKNACSNSTLKVKLKIHYKM